MSPKKTDFWQLLNARAVPGLLLFSLMASLILVLVSTPADAQNFLPNPLQNPICSRIDNQIQVSLGLRIYCLDDSRTVLGLGPHHPAFSRAQEPLLTAEVGRLALAGTSMPPVLQKTSPPAARGRMGRRRPR